MNVLKKKIYDFLFGKHVFEKTFKKIFKYKKKIEKIVQYIKTYLSTVYIKIINIFLKVLTKETYLSTVQITPKDFDQKVR